MTYSEKLKDPRWKLKRSKILERDNNTCQRCRWDDTAVLHVHHIKYTGEPWEAPDSDLITLCDTCHESVEGRISFGEKMTREIILNIRDNSKPMKIYTFPEFFERHNGLEILFKLTNGRR